MNIHLQRAQLLMQQRRYELAIEQLQLALVEPENRNLAHAYLALCLVEREQFNEAEHHARQAIAEAPDESFSMYALACVLSARNRLDEADAAIREAIQLEPTDPAYFAVLSQLHYQRYRWQECLDAANEGLARDPDHDTCINLRSLALVKLGRREEAGQSIEAALHHNPEDPFTHANQGWTLLHERQPLKAMEHFKEALRLDPNLEWARAGIVEAMKARNFVYRWLLMLFLWMQRFSPRVQIALVLGLMFGNRLVVARMDAVPALAPYSIYVALAYVLFVWMVSTAPTLFNLVLRLNPFGRLVLNDREKLDASLALACITACLITGIAGFASIVSTKLYWETSLLFLGLMLPVTSCFKLTGSKLKVMVAYSVGLATVILFDLWKLGQVELFVRSLADPDKATPQELLLVKSYVKEWGVWFLYGVNGVVWSTWLSAGLFVAPQERR